MMQSFFMFSANSRAMILILVSILACISLNIQAGDTADITEQSELVDEIFSSFSDDQRF